MLNGKSIATAIVALSALIAAGSPAHAQSKFSDLICPNSTEPVREFDAKRRDSETPIDDLIASGSHVIESYQRCVDEKTTQVELGVTIGRSQAQISNDHGYENVHYAQVRAAQYAVVVGRLDRLLERYEAARTEQRLALDLVNVTINWQSPLQQSYRSNDIAIGSGSSHNATTYHSAYRDSAIAIRDSAQSELDRLPPAPASAATPPAK
jgi:hypothetical protein